MGHDLIPQIRYLYDQVKPQWDEYSERLPGVAPLVREVTKDLPSPIKVAFYDAALKFEAAEDCFCDLGRPEATHTYLAMLEKKQRHLDNPTSCTAWFYRSLIGVFDLIRPVGVSEGSSLFDMPLWATLRDPADTIERIASILGEPSLNNHTLFLGFMDRYRANLYRAANSSARAYPDWTKLPGPTRSKLSPEEIVDTYLAGTPLHRLFFTPVPVPVSAELRFSHTWVVAPTGGGKTTMLKNLVLNDLQSDERPGLIILDPHSDLADKVKRADIGVSDRLVIIDPRDRNPPTINIFALPRARIAGYDAETRERMMNNIIETFSFFFGSFGVQTSGRQDMFFQNLTQLLLLFPDAIGRNATIEDMYRISVDPDDKNQLPEEYRRVLPHLDDVAQTFFKTDFYSVAFKGTRDAVRGRLYSILQQPALRRMLVAQETTIDLVSEMAKGSIILLDAAQDHLGKKMAGVFSSLMTTFVLQAVQMRLAPGYERRPVFLYIDEAGQTLAAGGGIEDLLFDARKARVGLVIANHNLVQTTTPILRAGLKSVACKFVGPEDTAAQELAVGMRTNRDAILAVPLFSFAMHVRGMKKPVVITPASDPFEDLPKLSESAVEELMARNRARFSGRTKAVAYTQPEQPYPIAAEDPVEYSPGPDLDYDPK